MSAICTSVVPSFFNSNFADCFFMLHAVLAQAKKKTSAPRHCFSWLQTIRGAGGQMGCGVQRILYACFVVCLFACLLEYPLSFLLTSFIVCFLALLCLAWLGLLCLALLGLLCFFLAWLCSVLLGFALLCRALLCSALPCLLVTVMT